MACFHFATSYFVILTDWRYHSTLFAKVEIFYSINRVTLAGFIVYASNEQLQRVQAILGSLLKTNSKHGIHRVARALEETPGRMARLKREA